MKRPKRVRYRRMKKLIDTLKNFVDPYHFNMGNCRFCAWGYYCERYRKRTGFSIPRIARHFGITQDEAIDLFAASEAGPLTVAARLESFIGEPARDHTEVAEEALA